MSAEVHLAAGRKVAHGELVCAIPTDKSRLGIAQLSRHLLHQAVRWEVIIQQHHPGRVAAKEFVSKSINDIVLHIFIISLIR